MFVNKRILCTLCLEYAPDCDLGNKKEILKMIRVVTGIRLKCDFTFHVCAKCLISLKAAYRVQQRFVRAIQSFTSLAEHEKVEHVSTASNFNEVIALYPGKECLICQQVVSAENMGQHLNEHFETELTCDICNITVANIRDYKTHCKLTKHAEMIYYCPECDVTFLYKSLYNIHIKEHKMCKKIDEPEQIHFEMGFNPENICVQELSEEVNFSSFQEQPIIECEARGKRLPIIKEVRVKKSKNISEKDPKNEKKKTYDKDSARKELNIIEPERCGPQKKRPKNPDDEVIEIILKEDPKIVAKSKVVENANENGETKIKRPKIKRRRLGGRPKQSKYVRLVTKIKRIFKGEETIYDKVEVVARADLEKIKEERAKVKAEVAEPKEEPSKTIWDIMNEEPPMEQPTEKPVESKGKFVCEMCSTPVDVHECPERKMICGHCTEYSIDIAPKDESKRTIWDIMNEETPEEPAPKTEKVKCQDCSVIMDMNLHRCLNRMVLCEYCGLSSTVKNARRHLLSKHSKGNFFKCNICGRICTNPIQLEKHKFRQHGPVKKFVCSYCGKNFPRSTTMRVHERQHTNEAPYKCDICGEAFKQNVLLRRHRGSVHKLFETMVCACDKCGKEFSSNIALESHIHRVHSGTESKEESRFS